MKSATSTNGAKQIIVFTRGDLTPQDKKRLEKYGILAVESDDPSKVRTHFTSIPMFEGNDILMMALKCLANSVKDENASPAAKFTKELAAAAQGKKP